MLRVRACLPGLRPAERRVADAVLADPIAVSHMAIGTLAGACDTSEATVVRFCRAVGTSGYAALRLALAAERGREVTAAPAPTGRIHPDDSLDEVVRTIGYADARAIEDTTANLDLDALGRAVHVVAEAGHVDIVGLGASGLVAGDLAQKLTRIGRRSTAWVDPHAALTSAALLRAGDALVAISHTGATPETIEAVLVGQRGGAHIVAITNTPASALARHADVVLATVARETTFRSGAMASRIAQLAIVDCLFVGVARLSRDATEAALASTYAAVQQRGSRRTPRQ